MARDVKKQAEKGRKRISHGRDITCTDLEQLWKIAYDPEDEYSLWTALTTAYDFGFYQGYEQRKTEKAGRKAAKKADSSIAEKLRNLRGDKPKQIVASAVGITTKALTQYENGGRIPRDEIKLRLADYYQTTVNAIFC